MDVYFFYGEKEVKARYMMRKILYSELVRSAYVIEKARPLCATTEGRGFAPARLTFAFSYQEFRALKSITLFGSRLSLHPLQPM